MSNLSMTWNCKYCGKLCPSASSRITHESACPEMKYFADFVLTHSEIVKKQAVVGGVETSDARIVAIVRAAQTVGLKGAS